MPGESVLNASSRWGGPGTCSAWVDVTRTQLGGPHCPKAPPSRPLYMQGPAGALKRRVAKTAGGLEGHTASRPRRTPHRSVQPGC